MRVFLTFLVVTIFIVVLGIGTGFAFVSSAMQEAVEDDLVLIAAIADELVSDEIRLLKADAEHVAQQLALSSDADILSILEDEQRTFDNRFTSFTVLDRQGVILQVGDYPTSASLLEDTYLQTAFNGESVISTTREEADGTLSLHVCIPIDSERVLSATVPGLHFDDLLSNFTVWDTGHIVIVDGQGTILASTDPLWVSDRMNFIEMAQTNSRYASVASVAATMVAGRTGVMTFTVNDSEKLCAYQPVTSSKTGWALGVVVPLAESPANNAVLGVVLVGVVCLMLSIAFGFLASLFIEKPYLQAKELKEKAETASEAKSSFLANMSHEMRTPLNAVIGLSELSLLTEEISEPVHSNLEKIYNSGVTLLGLINDILDLSKVEAGKLELIPVDYDMPSLINDTIVLNSVRIGSKPIEFKLLIDEDLPDRLLGDDLRVRQIFNNLLSNAFKYTKEGHVDWLVSCEREGDDVWLTSSVTDTGIGMIPEDVAKLFSDYSQVDVQSNRTTEGTGLGLSLTKKMVGLMGGTISVESEYGIGSTFTVRMRQGFVTEATIGREVAQKLRAAQYYDEKRDRNALLVRSQIPSARVLVVDDVATNLDVAKGLMRPYQMQVDCVTSGIEAIRRIRSGEPHYDAVFMDHMMPGMDGLEVTRVIREEVDSDYARSVPIIALTANAIVGNEEMFLGKGFQAFLSKPIDIMRLDTVINQFVRDRIRKDRRDAATVEEAEDTPKQHTSTNQHDDIRRRALAGHHFEGIDFSAGLKRFGDDLETYWTALGSYVKNTPGLLEKAEHYYHSGSLSDDYTICVHGIKGASRAICADEIGQLAEDLEHAADAADLAFVVAHHATFVQTTAILLAELRGMLVKSESQTTREQREQPDREALAALLKASRAFDIDGADQAMEQLEAYDYKQGASLVVWLREQIALMGFKAIAERLGDELGTCDTKQQEGDTDEHY